MLPGGDEVIIEDEFPEARAEIEATSTSVATPKSAKVATSSQASSEMTSATAASQICLIPQTDLFKKALYGLHHGIGKLELNNLMRLAVHGMRDGIGLNRVVFALLTKHPDKLVSRYSIGSDNDPNFSRFEISLDRPHLFTRLLEKQASLWINADNCTKFWPSIPGHFKTLIKTTSFFAMSIHVDDKPVGLFYADRRNADCELDETAYKQFRQICQLVAKGLANLAK
jgi:hypothetical protein